MVQITINWTGGWVWLKGWVGGDIWINNKLSYVGLKVRAGAEHGKK